ncbi:hypothetical protein BVRB_7g172930 [Beta vulgaris subsp. vulgaris]|nr:hypothetical protein BVRB_7g172930 [Beta vulgaris subsp. vulgaris]
MACRAPHYGFEVTSVSIQCLEKGILESICSKDCADNPREK